MAHFLLNRCHTPDPWHASILSIDVTQFPYGGQLSTEGAPGLPNRLKSAAVRLRLIIFSIGICCHKVAWITSGLPTIRELSRPATSERDVLLRRLVRIRAWHPCRMASKNLEMYRAFALSSTPSLRWHGPLVQAALQTSSISAGWTIRVYLQSKLWARDGRLRFIQATCHEFWKLSGKL